MGKDYEGPPTPLIVTARESGSRSRFLLLMLLLSITPGYNSWLCEPSFHLIFHLVGHISPEVLKPLDPEKHKSKLVPSAAKGPE